jgi:hypothetical protein
VSKNTWQTIDLKSVRGPEQAPGTPGQQILFINNGKANISTKLQHQVMMLPEESVIKSTQIKGRASPRGYVENQALLDAQKRNNNF